MDWKIGWKCKTNVKWRFERRSSVFGSDELSSTATDATAAIVLQLFCLQSVKQAADGGSMDHPCVGVSLGGEMLREVLVGFLSNTKACHFSFKAWHLSLKADVQVLELSCRSEAFKQVRRSVI